MTSQGNAPTSPRKRRVAVLIKQVPRFDDIRLGANGRLVREGVELEINPYCRRAVSKGVEIAQSDGGECIVFTLGPPCAEDVLREAVAWGADRGVLISDPAFAGSDTIATARTLAAALRRWGEFDLVLTGLNSVDADTGQVPAQVAALMDLPFAAAVRELRLAKRVADVVLEQDNVRVAASISLPCVLGVAERLCAPAKKPPEERARVSASRIEHIHARELGAGPWGEAASRTRVGPVRPAPPPSRMRRKLKGPVAKQVREAVSLLKQRNAFAPPSVGPAEPVPTSTDGSGPLLCVLADPHSPLTERALCAEAARLAQTLNGTVAAITPGMSDDADLASWGADVILRVRGGTVAEDFTNSIKDWLAERVPWAILAPSSPWGREAAARLACHLDAGLTGDAVSLEIGHDGRLIAWKPAFGGNMLAPISAESPVQMVTVRRGVLPLRQPRTGHTPQASVIEAHQTGRLRIHAIDHADDVEPLLAARCVIGVGQSVPEDALGDLEPLRVTLQAELAATRKVTDKGWLPRARQVGVTGITIAPDLYVAIGISGKFNHTVGIRSAGLILAINNDPAAPIFDVADIGVVADWREAVPCLVDRLARLERTA